MSYVEAYAIVDMAEALRGAKERMPFNSDEQVGIEATLHMWNEQINEARAVLRNIERGYDETV